MGIQIKKFQAATLQKAIEQIRAEMGDNAIILQTEPIKNSGGLGLFGRHAVEVTAAIDRKELAPNFHATANESKAERAPASKIDRATNASKGLLSGIFQGSKSKTAKPEVEKRKNEVAAAVKQYAVQASVASSRDTASSATTTNLSSGIAPAGSSPSVTQLYAMKTFIEPLQKEMEALKRKLLPKEGAAPRKRIRDPLELEVQSLRHQLSAFITEKRYESIELPQYYRSLLQFWTEKGMSVPQVMSFFKEMEQLGESFLADGSSVNTALKERIAEDNSPQHSEQKIVVLVGPTGVGKTTTIAKMAAYQKLSLKRSVAMVSMDDYKIGGTDQMAHYARILEVPFFKSRNDMSLEDQCRMQREDTIFVDTFGVSARDDERLQSLKNLLTFKDGEMKSKVEVHLVMPVSIANADVEDWTKRFSELKPDYLLFTKWDETDNWGGMLSAILASKKPVSFVCHGQNVPDDMSHFSKKEFIDTVTHISNGDN